MVMPPQTVVCLCIIAIVACSGCWTETVYGGPSAVAYPVDDTCVILRHGLGRTPRLVASLAHELENRGYRVNDLFSPSKDCPIETLPRRFWVPAVLRGKDAGWVNLHMVTHSLGDNDPPISPRPYAAFRKPHRHATSADSEK